jgi:hypothetical protein
MRGGHGLDAPFECSYEIVNRLAPVTREFGNHGHPCKRVLDAVVKLGRQYSLSLFCSPSLRDVYA